MSISLVRLPGDTARRGWNAFMIHTSYLRESEVSLVQHLTLHVTLGGRAHTCPQDFRALGCLVHRSPPSRHAGLCVLVERSAALAPLERRFHPLPPPWSGPRPGGRAGAVETRWAPAEAARPLCRVDDKTTPR